MAQTKEEIDKYQHKYREENKQKISIKNKKYYESKRSVAFKKNPQSYLYSVAKSRAKQKGIEFTIDVADVVMLDYCKITGKQLIKTNGYSPDSASIDRIDNSKGYIKGNICIISRWANMKKSSLNESDLIKLLAYVRGQL